MHMTKRFRFCLVSFFLSVSLIQAQNNVDSLQALLKEISGKGRIDILNDIASTYLTQRQTQKAYDFARKSLNENKKYNKEEKKVIPLNIIAFYHLKDNYDSAIFFANLAFEIAKRYENKKEEARALGYLGSASFFKSEYQKAYKYWQSSLKINKSLELESEYATLYNNIGVIHRIWGEYGKAIEYFHDALRIHEKTRDTLAIAKAVSNIGNIYFYFGIDLKKALEYYQRGLKFFNALKDSIQIANIKNNIGNIYLKEENYELALAQFEESLEIFNKQHNEQGIANTYLYLGPTYKEKKEYQKALNYFLKAQKIFSNLGDKRNYALSFANMADTYKDMKDYGKSIRYYNIFFNEANQLNLRKDFLDQYEKISEVYEKAGNYIDALKFYKKYASIRDSLINEENVKQLSEMEAKYENEKKSNEIKLQQTIIDKKELENKRQQWVIGFSILLIVSIFLVLLLIYRQFRVKKKANILLQQQNEEIKAQRDKIARQNKEITDSITYASIIQSAILTPHHLFEEYFPEHFIYYKPKNIVSGDFYWMTRKKDKILVAVADCTGHGVPGAFMSMLGMAFLSEIIGKPELGTSDEILNELKEKIISSLHQKDAETETKDGLDIALCIIDRKQMNLQFTGAFNPLYIISDNNLDIIRGDRIPIGFSFREGTYFTRHDIKIKEGDMIYMFSDGYYDQFGGENRKKFMAKRFIHLLLDISQFSLKKQEEWLDKTLVDWMEDNEQVDDITVVGIKI